MISKYGKRSEFSLVWMAIGIFLNLVGLGCIISLTHIKGHVNNILAIILIVFGVMLYPTGLIITIYHAIRFFPIIDGNKDIKVTHYKDLPKVTNQMIDKTKNDLRK